MNPTIIKVTATPVFASFERVYGAGNIPSEILRPAAHFQSIPRRGQYSTIVEIEADNGAMGFGEAFGLPHPGAATVLVREVVGPALLGVSLRSAMDRLAEINRFLSALGHTKGPAMEATSALDIAIWDLQCRIDGEALDRALGGVGDPVELYVSPVPFLDTPLKTYEAAESFVAQGYTALKLKIGRGVTTDLSHVEAARSAVGPGVRLMLDANCAYQVEEAKELARNLSPFSIAWLEEPVASGTAEDLAAVRRVANVPIAAGENEFTPAALEALLAANAVDIVQPNITRAGGVTGMLRIAETCDRYRASLVPHGVGGGICLAAGVHVASALPGIVLFEANRLPNPIRDELFDGAVIVGNGQAVPNGGPGHGVRPKPDLLKELEWSCGGKNSDFEELV